MTEAPQRHAPIHQSAHDPGRGTRRRRPTTSAATVHRSHRRAHRRGDCFYAGALDAADRERLADAAAVRGIDQEIAVLRLRLRHVLTEQPEDFALVVRSIELLVRAVGAAGKLAADNTVEALDRICAELGGVVALITEANEDSGQ
jgi:hypothetical protein